MSKVASKASNKVVCTPSRREFAAMGAVAAALCSGNAVAAPIALTAQPANTSAASVKIDGNLFRPENGEHPGLVMFASAAASRSANAAVAQQLAAQGWAVLLVDGDAVTDPTQLNRKARAHVEWLTVQAGVKSVRSAKRDFVLQNFSAALPKLSLASREERRAAASSGVLFAAPAKLLNSMAARRESLSAAARSLHRLSA